MKITDMLVVLKQSGQTTYEHGLSLIFIEFRQHQRLGKLETIFFKGVAHESGSIFLPDAWPDAHAVESDFTLRPIIAEKECLRFSELR